MHETEPQIAELQELLDRSIAGPERHLTSIIEPGRRTLTAEQLVAELIGICILNVATVTARCEPRLSAVDGHFLGARWYFGTEAAALKARHLAVRPALSVAYTPRDGVGVWAHGRAEPVVRGTPEWAMFDAHERLTYGQSPQGWGDDIVYFRVEPSWMVGFSMETETSNTTEKES